jgi:predicted N-acetyltransferase YhbS
MPSQTENVTDRPMENLRIRNIETGDAEAIRRIQGAITKSPVTTDFGQIIRDQKQEGRDASFVAELDGKIVGYMISYTVYAGFGLDKSAWIATLGVDPRFMGQGIGRQLAEAVFHAYREMGVRHILTSVRWDSADLLSFFKTLGFDRSDFINLLKEMEP